MVFFLLLLLYAGELIVIFVDGTQFKYTRVSTHTHTVCTSNSRYDYLMLPCRNFCQPFQESVEEKRHLHENVPKFIHQKMHYLRLWSMCIDGLDRQLDVFHLTTICNRSQFDYCVQWHLKIRQNLCKSNVNTNEKKKKHEQE